MLGRFIFKLFTTFQPQYLFSMFTFRSSIHSRVLRADGRLIHIPTRRTEIAHRSFVGSVVEYTLPSHIRKSRSLSSSITYSRCICSGGGWVTVSLVDSSARAGPGLLSGLGGVGLVINYVMRETCSIQC